VNYWKSYTNPILMFARFYLYLEQCYSSRNLYITLLFIVRNLKFKFINLKNLKQDKLILINTLLRTN